MPETFDQMFEDTKKRAAQLIEMRVDPNDAFQLVLAIRGQKLQEDAFVRTDPSGGPK